MAKQNSPKFYQKTLATPLGEMTAIADETHLYLLEFSDSKRLEQKIKRLQKQTNALVKKEASALLFRLQEELDYYFKGQLQDFQTPVHCWGTAFQKKAWQTLQRIPYGETRTYGGQAKSAGCEQAVRAIANANGANPCAILVPCHRVLRSNGDLGGYAAGTERKSWLLAHEKRTCKREKFKTIG